MPRDLPEDSDWIRAHQQAFGAKLQATRLKRNLTQEAVYLAAGLDRRTLQAIEGGHGNPTLATLLRLARALGVPLAELLK